MTIPEEILIDTSTAPLSAAASLLHSELPTTTCTTLVTLEQAGGLRSKKASIETRADHAAVNSDFLPGEKDPLVLAGEIAKRIRAGVRSVVRACVLLNEGSRLYETDPALLDQFRNALVREKVIGRRSARLGGVEKSMLSMLRKIGESADLLLDERIFKFLEPGRSVLYYVTRLFKVIPGDYDDRVSRLVEIFEPEGSLSRDFLVEALKKIEREQQVKDSIAPDPWVSSTTERNVDCALLTPSRRDLERLRDDRADGSPLSPRILNRVADDAIAIVLARLVDLPIIADKLLPSCGFAEISWVLLAHDPVHPDATNSQVIIVAERGSVGSVRAAEFRWFPDNTQVDPGSLAAQLAPDSKHRLQLFASAKNDGWDSVIGEANWSQVDE